MAQIPAVQTFPQQSAFTLQGWPFSFAPTQHAKWPVPRSWQVRAGVAVQQSAVVAQPLVIAAQA